MNKTDKEYVDAQIESVEEKFEARLKEAYEKVCNQNSLPKDPKGNVTIPAINSHRPRVVRNSCAKNRQRRV